MIEADLHQFIARSKLGVLSTIAETGTPQSALVGIAITPNLEIVFDTVKSSRKYPNLIARQQCSFVIGWTGEQIREKFREAELRQRVVTDAHAPAEYRGDTVRNLDPWYDAFGVKPGQKLYLAPAERVRVW